MNRKYILTLLTLLMACYFVPAQAQQKPTAKKPAPKKVTPVKTAPKTTAKPVVKAPTVQQKNTAKNLGDAASNVAVTDTTRKGGNGNNPPANTGALAEEIVVTTEYKPVLAEAVKIRRNPDLAEKIPFKAPLNYNPLDKRLEQDNNIRQLDPQQRPPERDSALLNNYVKVGAGNIKSTYAEGYFTNGRDEAMQVGGYVKHFAQAGSLNKQNDSRQQVGVFGKTIYDDNTLSGRLDYKRRGTYFYGFDQNASTAPVFTPQKQTFNTVSGEAELAKQYKDVENDFTYDFKAKGYLFSNAFAARENNFVLTGFVNQTVKQFYAGLSATLDLASQKDSAYSYNNSILRANPYIKFQGENYKIEAGVNIAQEFGFSSRFYLFPAAKAEVQIIPKYVRLFAEAKGDINRSSLRDFAEQSPFIGQNIQIRNSVDLLDVAVGLKGTLAPGLGFKAAVFRNTVRSLPLFVNNFAAEFNKFAVIYDNGKANITGFNGELDFKATEDVNIFGRVEYKNYDLATEAEAWNLPNFVLSAGTAIHINDKVDITGSLLFRGTAYDPMPVGSATRSTIKSFADLSGGATYKVTKQISVFVQANNILNATNQTYLYYPNYGFNIFGGAGFSF